MASSSLVKQIVVHEDIMACVADAILKLDEAWGIAASEFGDKDKRTLTIADVWTEACSLRQWVLESIATLKAEGGLKDGV